MANDVHILCGYGYSCSANTPVYSSHSIPLFSRKKTEPKNASTVFRYAETGECLRTPGMGRQLYFRVRK